MLGVSDTATDKEIGKAYRKLAKQYHPDANPGSEERFKEISAAYDVLGDADQRKEYDEVRRLGPAGNPLPTRAPGGVQAPPATSRSATWGTCSATSSGGVTAAGAPEAAAPAGPPSGRNAGRTSKPSCICRSSTPSTGSPPPSMSPRRLPATPVAVRGAAPGTAPVVCPVCGGRGVINDNQGLFSFSQPCQTCAGTGMRIEHPCPTCLGLGVEHRARQVKVRVPAGVEDGQRIRVKGRGGAGRGGGPAGDLYVVVHADRHPVFGRRGKDLTVTVPVTFPEAALGAKVAVPTLDGPVTVKVPAGSKAGKTLRVRGRGVPASSGVGDLLVTVDVAVPDRLSDEARKSVEALGDLHRRRSPARTSCGVSGDGS